MAILWAFAFAGATLGWAVGDDGAILTATTATLPSPGSRTPWTSSVGC